MDLTKDLVLEEKDEMNLYQLYSSWFIFVDEMF